MSSRRSASHPATFRHMPGRKVLGWCFEETRHHGILRSVMLGFAITVIAALLAIAGGFIPAVTAQAKPESTPQAVQPDVVVIHLDDTIQPISADFLSRGLKIAAEKHASAVVIEMNTPGGLLSSMRQMVSEILSSPVPVIIYVTPSGSRAGSAGFFLLESADIAAMAPGTNAGAAHPVFEGVKVGATLKTKIENDTEALLRSYVSRRGRNVDAALDAVRNSKSYSDKEALQLGLIDLIAPNRATLLQDVNGRTVTRISGAKVTLDTAGAHITEVHATLRERILDRLTNPDLALLILVVGGMLIYVEFSAPGTIVPGTLGTILVLVALFALNLLPVRYTAVLLLIAGFTLLILEAKFVSHGIFAAAGIICLVFGSLTLVAGPIPQMRVHLGTALAVGFSFGLISVFLLRLAIRSHRSKMQTGGSALIGQIAVVTRPLAPSGTETGEVMAGLVMVHGEIWQAESPTPIESGARVRIREIRDLTLLVEPVR